MGFTIYDLGFTGSTLWLTIAEVFCVRCLQHDKLNVNCQPRIFEFFEFENLKDFKLCDSATLLEILSG
jgi:hypothetical protein